MSKTTRFCFCLFQNGLCPNFYSKCVLFSSSIYCQKWFLHLRSALSETSLNVSISSQLREPFICPLFSIMSYLMPLIRRSFEKIKTPSLFCGTDGFSIDGGLFHFCNGFYKDTIGGVTYFWCFPLECMTSRHTIFVSERDELSNTFQFHCNVEHPTRL